MDDSALILKYRPELFGDMIGHEEVVKSLTNAIDNQLSHNFLFTGPAGVGKTSLARITARACLCGDVQEIDAATNSGVEAMRNVTQGLRYKPLIRTDKNLPLFWQD